MWDFGELLDPVGFSTFFNPRLRQALIKQIPRCNTINLLQQWSCVAMRLSPALIASTN